MLPKFVQQYQKGLILRQQPVFFFFFREWYRAQDAIALKWFHKNVKDGLL